MAVDITKDRVLCVFGGTMFHTSDSYLAPTDPAPVWVTLVPTEPEHEQPPALTPGAKVWPRERQFRVEHECVVGTVDEIVELLRARTVRSFQALTLADMAAAGVAVNIPCMRGPDLGPQNAVWERNGVTGLRVVPWADPALLEARQDRRAEMRGVPYRQDAATRDRLGRLLALWRRDYPPGSSDLAPVVESLVDALRVYAEDSNAWEKPVEAGEA